MRVRIRRAAGATWVLAILALASFSAAPAARPSPVRQAATAGADFDRMLRDQADTDRAWQEASNGYMRTEKITYRSKAGDLDVPAFLFQPLASQGTHMHPALVWVHENIRGHLYEHYIPYIREATARGYVVIAPEYRGSIGYGKAFYDAIDYGGAEVDDVVTAVEVLKSRVPAVDPARIGIIGWSHGGMITLLSVTRNPGLFKALVAMVPVTNLFQRLAWKGEERYRSQIDPQNRLGGLPAERHDTYKARSPLYQIDNIDIPILVHVARNDDDVNFEEDEQLVDALRSRKPALAETKIYDAPPGGHTFDRRVDPKTWQPENTPEQRDSWQRIWDFFHRTLGGE